MSQNHVTIPTGAALRVKALEALLKEKGLVDESALDAIVDRLFVEPRMENHSARSKDAILGITALSGLSHGA